jgi:hypothetical protein
MGGYFLSTKAFAVVLAVLGAIALGTGCGGSEDSASGIAVKSGSLSKAEFIKRADHVCYTGQARGQAQAIAFAKKNKILQGGNISRDEAASIINSVLVPLYLQEAKEIAALGAPKSDVADVSEIVAAVESDMEQAKANPLEVMNSGHTLPTAQQKATAYGLALCGSVWV